MPTAPRRRVLARFVPPLAGGIAAVFLPAVRAAEPPAASMPTPTTQAVEVPFDFSQGVVLLDVDFGGSRPAKMMLDADDGESLLDLASARALGLPLDVQNLKAAGSGKGAVTFFQTTPPRVRLGAAEFADPLVIVMPNTSRNLLGDTGVRCEGTLGHDLFKGQVVQIDYPARKLRLLGADAASQWRRDHAASPPLVTPDQLRIGGRAVRAVLDTCCAQGLLLFTTMLPGLESRPAAGVPPAQYYGGATLPAATLAAPVTLGKLGFKTNLVVHLAGEDAPLPAADVAAVVGNRFFQDNVLTIDFQEGHITVEWK